MVIQIRPLEDRVVIEPVDESETIAGGMLVLPEMAKEKPQQGRVLAVGDGRRDDNGQRIGMDVRIGDKVMFARYAGSEITIDRKKLLIVKESEILGIVDETS